MDLLARLRSEDDNPRGQEGGLFRSGASLEDAAEAEARRQEIKSQKWPIGRQEAGILHIVTAKNFFQRLRVAEPRLDSGGKPVWSVSAQAVERAYDEAKKCCHPEWAFHPKRVQGFAALTEAYETLRDDAKRDAYVAEFAVGLAERQRTLEAEAETAASEGAGGAPLSAAAAAAAAAAATAEDMRARMLAKRKRMEEQSAARRRPGAALHAAVGAAIGAVPAPRPSGSAARRAMSSARADGDGDGDGLADEEAAAAEEEEEEGGGLVAVRSGKPKKTIQKKRRPGVF